MRSQANQSWGNCLPVAPTVASVVKGLKVFIRGKRTPCPTGYGLGSYHSGSIVGPSENSSQSSNSRWRFLPSCDGHRLGNHSGTLRTLREGKKRKNSIVFFSRPDQKSLVSFPSIFSLRFASPS